MKKKLATILAVAVVAAMSLGLAACGASSDSADGGEASLSVTGGTFRVSTPSAVKSTFSGNVTVGNSLKWNGYNLAIQNPGNTPAADTIYIF